MYVLESFFFSFVNDIKRRTGGQGEANLSSGTRDRCVYICYVGGGARACRVRGWWRNSITTIPSTGISFASPYSSSLSSFLFSLPSRTVFFFFPLCFLPFVRSLQQLVAWTDAQFSLRCWTGDRERDRSGHYGAARASGTYQCAPSSIPRFQPPSHSAQPSSIDRVKRVPCMFLER